ANRGAATTANRGATTAGGGTLTVDAAGNRLIFNGTAAEWQSMRYLLGQLDTAVRQVIINVTFAEVTLTDQTRAGVEWFVNQGSFGGTVSGGTRGALGIATSGAVFDFIRGSATAPDIRASFEAFASNNKVNVLLNPRLSATNAVQAALSVGDVVPYITNTTTNTSTTGGTPVVTNQFGSQQTGVTLNFTPQIHGSDQVDITISLDVKSVKESTNPAIPTPTFPSRTISTTLSLVSGKTGVLGGLMSDNFSKGNSGIPLLKDVPVLGNMFRTNTIDGSKTALLLLITPFIVNGADDMATISANLSGEMNDAFKVGTGPSYTLTGINDRYSLGIGLPSPNIRASNAPLQIQQVDAPPPPAAPEPPPLPPPAPVPAAAPPPVQNVTPPPPAAQGAAQGAAAGGRGGGGRGGAPAPANRGAAPAGP
ncbi:MAG: hypothetical protein JWM33_1886, partial [Caulobacteraceae bacterium]|nr:hypothetical protein [Caulobacteraceae bacterium]